jgi:hypothetical protein
LDITCFILKTKQVSLCLRNKAGYPLLSTKNEHGIYFILIIGYILTPFFLNLKIKFEQHISLKKYDFQKLSINCATKPPPPPPPNLLWQDGHLFWHVLENSKFTYKSIKMQGYLKTSVGNDLTCIVWYLKYLCFFTM